jgi:hypothetical protein
MSYFRTNPKKTWEIKSIKENLGALGFLDIGVDTVSPNISPRGKSLQVLNRLFDMNVLSKDNLEILSKYILLKAICDIDWYCFSHLVFYKYIKKEEPSEIHKNYYIYDKIGNWKHRWGFHNKIINEIGINKIINILGIDNIDEIKIKFDPYSSSFNFNQVFEQYYLHPCDDEVVKHILKSIKLYRKIYPEDKPVAYTEVLKSIIYVFLIKNNQFINETELSIIFSSKCNKINIYRSSIPTKNIGRGFYFEGEKLTYYPFFDI